MKIRYNENRELVDVIRKGILKKEGHCPCRREMSEDTTCMCREFREQVADPEFEG